MFIKLGIIAGVLILGGMIFSNEIDSLFPSTSASVVDSLKEDVSNFGAKASDSVEKRIDDLPNSKVRHEKDKERLKESLKAGKRYYGLLMQTVDSDLSIISEEMLGKLFEKEVEKVKKEGVQATLDFQGVNLR